MSWCTFRSSLIAHCKLPFARETRAAATKNSNDWLEWQEWRSRTPGADRVVHLNNAGASLLDKRTIETVETFFHREATIGGYEVAEMDRVVDLCYSSLGDALKSCSSFLLRWRVSIPPGDALPKQTQSLAPVACSQRPS